MMKWIFGPNLVQKIDRLGTYAGALAYNFVLSLAPFLIVTAAAATLVSPISLTSKYEDILEAVLPMETSADRQMIVHAVSQSSSRGLATFGFLLAVYTSYSFMTQIVRTLLFIFDHPRGARISSFREFIKSVVLLFLWMTFLVVICMSFVILPIIRSMIDSLTIVRRFHDLPLPGMPQMDFFAVVSDVVVLVTLFAAFFLTYRLVSSNQFPSKVVLQASFISTLGWFACSVLYVLVLQRIWSANAIYGAFGSVMAILLWGQSCAWTVIIGACWIVRFSPPPKKTKSATVALPPVPAKTTKSTKQREQRNAGPSSLTLPSRLATPE